MKQPTTTVAVIGAGPAGLMAAEVLSHHGIQVDVYDAKPSVGRKFLLAGKGGMNITHSEPFAQFVGRYDQPQWLAPMLEKFGADDVRQWLLALGFDSFVGSSGRVFPTDMKAAPLLRAWLHRLREAGVKFHVRHRWLGWHESGALLFHTPESERLITANAVILALGGGSWPQLGSDGAWLPVLQQQGVETVPLQATNCGFDGDWSPYFAERFAGQPVKSSVVSFVDTQEQWQSKKGDFVITATGIEGSLIYAVSRQLREVINQNGQVTIQLDLLPHKTVEQVLAALLKPRGSASLASFLRKQLHIDGVYAGLLRECTTKEIFNDMTLLAQAIKALPLTLTKTRPIAEAISSAGGVSWCALDNDLMLKQLPNVFCAGEMIDWEAPTGGYLLTACFATGRRAALAALAAVSATKPSGV